MSYDNPNDVHLLPAGYDTTKVLSEDPHIVQADKRIDRGPCFLYLPAHNPTTVFIDSYYQVLHLSSWPIWHTPPPPLPPPQILSFRLEERPGRGIGMVAIRPISAGELIYHERPVYAARRILPCAADQTVENGIFYRAAIHRLSPEARRSFLALYNASPASWDVVPGILGTNCLEIRIKEKPDHSADPAGRFIGCFPVLSRANHDCAPSAHYFFNVLTFEGELRAVKNLAVGEEITIAYTDLLAPRSKRQEYLTEKRYFTCRCNICSTSAEAIAQSDARRLTIRRLMEQLPSIDSTQMPERVALEDIQVALIAAEQEGLVSAYAQLLISGSQVITIYGDLQIAIDWAQRAKRIFIITEGARSYNVRAVEKAERIHAAMAAAPRGLRT